jgi:hypothetical protein
MAKKKKSKSKKSVAKESKGGSSSSSSSSAPTPAALPTVATITVTQDDTPEVFDLPENTSPITTTTATPIDEVITDSTVEEKCITNTNVLDATILLGACDEELHSPHSGKVIEEMEDVQIGEEEHAQEGGKEEGGKASEVSPLSSKWGLLPDIDSSDDEDIEEKEREEQQDDEQKEKEGEKQKEENQEEEGLDTTQGKEDMREVEDQQLSSPEVVKGEAPLTSMSRVVVNCDSDDSDSDDSDDDALISPYLTKHLSTTTEILCTHDATSPTVSTVTPPVVKKRLEKPAKVHIEENGYNTCDRGIKSGSAYLQQLKKADSSKKGTSIFSPESSVASRLASVKTDLEVLLNTIYACIDVHIYLALFTCGVRLSYICIFLSSTV